MNNVSFIESCASDFVEIYVGSGPKKVRELFETARQNKPCIIFIDELESIGIQRSSSAKEYTYHIENYSTLNQLLSEMDGLHSMKDIIVIAATNREDLLDSALVRPGRFDFKIAISTPDYNLRQEMYRLYLRKYGYFNYANDTEAVSSLAEKSEYFTGAIIENVINEAATLCSSKGKDLELEDIITSLDRNKAELYKFQGYDSRRDN